MTPPWSARPRGRTRRRPRSTGAIAYARAELPQSATHWRAARWCALDFELTGLDLERDDIVSFGAIPIDGGLIRLGGAVAGLVRPEYELSEPAIRVHNLRASDLAQAPPLAEAIAGLLPALAGRALVVHVSPIERTLLRRGLREVGLRLRGPVIDTEVLGRIWLHRRDGRLRRHLGLSDLATELGLPAERPHEALADALTTAQAFIALATHLDVDGPVTVGSLASADRRLEAIRLFHAG